jgi:hypothetical protein
MRECAIPSLNLAVHFLCHTYLRVRAKDASRVAAWVDLINQYSSAFKESAFWLIEYWASEDGLRHVRPFLLECPTRSIRHHFVNLLEISISNFFNHGGQTVSALVIIIKHGFINLYCLFVEPHSFD